MNFIEAVKSGKPFQRPVHRKDWVIENDDSVAAPNLVSRLDSADINAYPFVWADGKAAYFTKESILAEDWIIKEE